VEKVKPCSCQLQYRPYYVAYILIAIFGVFGIGVLSIGVYKYCKKRPAGHGQDLQPQAAEGANEGTIQVQMADAAL
jgi:hypothetical protein